MDFGKYAVIPTKDRPDQLWACINSIEAQVDEVIIVDNASDPPVESGPVGLSAAHNPRLNIFPDPEQPPNLSRLWNRGLGIAATFAQDDDFERWYVAILNDDALPPPGWMDAMVQALEETDAVAACSHPFGGGYQLFSSNEQPSVGTRVTGWAFVLKQPGLDFDERFRWWCQDDDVSMRARQSGGLVYVSGYPVPNTLANTSTNGVLAEQAGRDVQAFVDKWGVHPFLG